MNCKKCGVEIVKWDNDRGQKIFLCTNCDVVYNLSGDILDLNSEEVEQAGETIAIRFTFDSECAESIQLLYDWGNVLYPEFPQQVSMGWFKDRLGVMTKDDIKEIYVYKITDADCKQLIKRIKNLGLKGVLKYKITKENELK